MASLSVTYEELIELVKEDRDLSIYINLRVRNIQGELKRGLFDRFINLIFLFLNCSNITKIEVGAFDKLENLKYLYLDYNIITKIEVGTFDKLHNLKELSLSFNKIIEIKKGVFDKLVHLKLLSLRNNNIIKIEVGTFDKLMKLEYLFLKHNHIIYFDKHIFDKLTKLHSITISAHILKDSKGRILKYLTNLKYLAFNDNDDNDYMNLLDKYKYVPKTLEEKIKSKMTKSKARIAIFKEELYMKVYEPTKMTLERAELLC